MTSTNRATVTLPSDTEILVTRQFDAPRHLVFRAFTEPELVRRWWHAGRGVVTVAEIDLRVGGRWRYVIDTEGGLSVGFHGEYREIVPDERIVSTEVFEGYPGESLNTATLVEIDGRTMLTTLVQHANQVDRDAHLGSGMEAGMQDACALLEETALSLG
jgi:uncharacterized protein YndB with AHSA1/START domain